MGKYLPEYYPQDLRISNFNILDVGDMLMAEKHFAFKEDTQQIEGGFGPVNSIDVTFDYLLHDHGKEILEGSAAVTIQDITANYVVTP